MVNKLNLVDHRCILKLLAVKHLLYHQKFKGKFNTVFTKRLTFFVVYPAFFVRSIRLSQKQNLLVVFRVPLKISNNDSWSNAIQLQGTCVIYYFGVFGFTGCTICKRHYDCNTLCSNTTVAKQLFTIIA